MGKIKDAIERAKDTARFLTEPANSEDFGKSREDWQASKDARREGK